MQRRGRKPDEIREISIETSINKYAEGSCLISLGDTRVLVTASVENRVPHHLRGQGKGWVTAEYSMLPRATQNRTYREGRRRNLDGRTQEIQRLIGRALRAVTNLEVLGTRTIWIDCDVLQADGSTRITSIIGGFISYYQAVLHLLNQGIISDNPIFEYLGAVSVGLVNNNVVLDLEYREDLIADVDLNMIASESERIIEIQGAAEGTPFSRNDLDAMVDLGMLGIQKVIRIEKQVIESLT